jgi:hypothetical protein
LGTGAASTILLDQTTRQLPATPLAAAANTAPLITDLAESHRVWREDSARGSAKRNQRVPVGTAFSFVLSDEAGVRMAFTRRLRGREVDGSCVAATDQTRGEPACVRAVAIGTASLVAHAGMNTVVFAGAASGGEMAPAGHYTVALTATNSDGQRASTSQVRFTIVK